MKAQCCGCGAITDRWIKDAPLCRTCFPPLKRRTVVPKLHGIKQRTFQGFYEAKVLEPGQRVRYEFHKDGEDHEYIWLALAIRLLGMPRDEELFRLDWMMLRMFVTPNVKVTSGGEAWEDGFEWVQVEAGYNDLPASMCQEPHFFKLPRPLIIPNQPEGQPQTKFGVEAHYTPPDHLGAVNARIQILGLQTRDPGN